MPHASDSVVSTRPLNLLQLLALGMNGIVGVGIFFAPADVARLAPGGWSLGILAGMAVALLPVALVFARLGRVFHEDGGPVLFAEHAFGPFPAFLVGWLAYVCAVLSTAATLVGFTGSIGPRLGVHEPIALRLLAIGFTTTFMLIAAAGMHLSARVWTTLTALKLIPLVLLLAIACCWHPTLDPLLPSVREPVAVRSLLRAALTALFTYQGFEVIPMVSGQARHPGRDIPRAVVGSLALASLLYVALQWACVRALPHLAQSSSPLVDAASFYGGPLLGVCLAVGTNLSALGIAVGMALMTPRYLAAIGHSFGPRGNLAETSARGVPLRATGITWCLVVSLLLLGDRQDLFPLASLAVVMQYTLAAFALILLAHRRERGLHPRQAWVAYPALAVTALLLLEAKSAEWMMACATLSVGLLLRYLGRERRVDPAPSR